MSDAAALILCNEALLSLGEATLDDLDGDSSANSVARLKYQPIVDEMLGGHPWTFTRSIVTLNRLTTAPSAASGFSAAYQLPNLCFRVIVPFVNSYPQQEWGEAGAILYLDANAGDVVELEFHTRADDSLWRPGFRQAVVARLAAEFCIPITDDTQRAQLLYGLANQQLSKARHLNATEKPAIRMPTGKLARLRGR